MLEITNGSQKLRFYCQILQYPQDHRFTRSSQCGQLRPNIPSCHDLENGALETSKRFSLGE